MQKCNRNLKRQNNIKQTIKKIQYKILKIEKRSKTIKRNKKVIIKLLLYHIGLKS